MRDTTCDHDDLIYRCPACERGLIYDGCCICCGECYGDGGVDAVTEKPTEAQRLRAACHALNIAHASLTHRSLPPNAWDAYVRVAAGYLGLVLDDILDASEEHRRQKQASRN